MIGMDASAHDLFNFFPLGAKGSTSKGKYLVFYHEEMLYSVRNTEDWTLTLVLAVNPEEAIEKVGGGEG